MQVFVVTVAAFCLECGGSTISIHHLIWDPTIKAICRLTGDARCARCGPETMKKGRDKVGGGKKCTLFCLIDS